MEEVKVVYAMIMNEKKEVLMAENIKHQNWSLPGGRVERGETLQQAALREIREETGFQVEVINIISVNEAFVEKLNQHALFITFKADIIGGSLAVEDEATIKSARWMAVSEANEHLYYHPAGIDRLLKNQADYVFEGIKA